MTGSENGEEDDESIREAVERSRYGAPAAGAVVRDRFTTDEIFQRVLAAADEEMSTSTRELFFSGLAAGFAISVTFLLYVMMMSQTGEDPILGALLYPLGFVYIILGGYQLYTENTLPPVTLLLERLASFTALFWIWTVVLLGNVVGSSLGALVLATTGVFSPEAATVATGIAEKGLKTPFWDLFFKAAFAGLIVAGVVWLDYAARDTISRLVLVYVAFLAIPFGQLFHVVVSVTEVAYLLFSGQAVLVAGMTEFVLPVLLGNTLGGVALVAVVNYFQTAERRLETARGAEPQPKLSLGEWFLGGLVGQSYVPANLEPEEGDPRED